PPPATPPLSLHDALPILDGKLGNAADIWTWVCDWPIPEDVYRSVAERGEPWPGSDPVVIEQTGFGHNSGAVDEAEEFADQIDARSEEHTSELQSRENLVC